MMDAGANLHKSKITTLCEREAWSRVATTAEHWYPMAAVASRPFDPSSRHVGRIVDPMVREDGESEPELSLESGSVRVPTPAETVTAENVPASSTEGDAPDDAPVLEPARPDLPVMPSAPVPEPRSMTMRDRLLERAAAAAQRNVTPPREAVAARDDLDDIGRRGSDPGLPAESLPRA